MRAVSNESTYYLRSILRCLRVQLQSLEHDGPSLGHELLADNIAWLEGYLEDRPEGPTSDVAPQESLIDVPAGLFRYWNGYALKIRFDPDEGAVVCYRFGTPHEESFIYRVSLNPVLPVEHIPLFQLERALTLMQEKETER